MDRYEHVLNSWIKMWDVKGKISRSCNHPEIVKIDLLLWLL